MLLIHWTLQNLLLAMMFLHSVCTYSFQFTRLSHVHPVGNSRHVVADFQTNGVVLQSNCFILKRWCITLLGIYVQNRFFTWLQSLIIKLYKSINYIYATIYIWLKTTHRVLTNKIQCNPNIRSIHTYFYDDIYAVEGALHYFFALEINICFWTSLIVFHQLYPGPITKARHIFIKGVGGCIKVCGRGTMKIGIIDDANDDCDHVLSNVLYVPEYPTYLLSPPLWSDTTTKPAGTGENTLCGTTLLFWDDHTHTKTITHHPLLKLPIFSTPIEGEPCLGLYTRAVKCNRVYLDVFILQYQ